MKMVPPPTFYLCSPRHKPLEVKICQISHEMKARLSKIRVQNQRPQPDIFCVSAFMTF